MLYLKKLPFFVAKNISTPPAGRLAWLRARMAWLRLSAGANGWGPRYGFV